MCGLHNNYGVVSATGDARIDGLLSGLSWIGPITYAFPDQTTSYQYGGETDTEFYRANRLQKSAVSFALDSDFGDAANDGFSVEGFTNASIGLGPAATANIRSAQSALPPTSWAYFPGSNEHSGDVWLGVYSNVTVPKAGNYAWHTVMHEMGHALGLKHAHASQNGFGVLAPEHDTLEQSIMTYRSYAGAPIEDYTYEKWGAPQTFMMADIAALQSMYGADFDTNSTDTVYNWRPGSGDTFVNGELAIEPGGNIIFATIWDGGGVDTYDLSRFRSRLDIDLEPGGASTFNVNQLSSLGNGHKASGNIYNALQYQGDLRSLIENAIGGSNRDLISGNIADNALYGRRGNDRLHGMDGDDTLNGGAGHDWLSGGAGNDRLTGRGGNDHLSGGAGNDLMSGCAGRDVFIFGAGAGADVITDFQRGVDRISIQSGIHADIATIIDSARQIGDDVVLYLNDSQTVTLRDFSLGALDADTFMI